MTDASKHSWPTPAWVTPALVAVLGLSLSFVGFAAVRNAMIAELQGEFEESATRQLGQLQDAVNINTTLLRSIEGLYASSQFVSREEFEIFVRNQPLRKFGESIVGWVPRVPAAKRESVVQQARESGIADFRIWSSKSGAAPLPKSNLDLYPIYYLEPQEGNASLLGFDLASDPDARAALARARDNGEPVSTGRIELLPGSADAGAILMAYPRYKSPFPPDSDAKRRSDLVGFAVGVFQIKDFFEAGFGAAVSSDRDVFIYDLSAAPEPALLLSLFAKLQDEPDTDVSLNDLFEDYHWSGTMHVGGRTWLAIFRPVPDYIPVWGSWRSWLAAIIGVFVTILFTAYEWRRATHNRRIEALAADLSHSYTRLERETDERMMAEEQLRQSQKLEIVGKLTGGIAHDFNNLLTIILGNLETAIERTGESSGIAAQIRTAMNAAVRGAALTQRLLAYARRQVLEPEVIDLNCVVNAMTDLVRRSLGSAIEVKPSLAKDLWPAVADRNQVENALLNLVINSRDAMPAGGTLTLETQNVTLDAHHAGGQGELAPGDYVALAVSDTGVGMTRDIQERVFEPFFTTKEPGKGTGLGLSSIYGFARQSGGLLRIYSEPGLGTTVRLYLPRAEAAAAAAASSMPAAELPRGTETVLVAEDEAEVRAIAVSHLSKSGYRVIEAEDAASALAAAKGKDNIDLLLTDVVLAGGMNGQNLAAALRGRVPGLKVIFMSGYSEQGLHGSGQPHPGARLLQKPFRKSDLLKAVRDMLDGVSGA